MTELGQNARRVQDPSLEKEEKSRGNFVEILEIFCLICSNP